MDHLSIAPQTQVTNDELVAAVAAETGADTRTVVRRLVGLPVRGAAGRAVDAALARRGLLPRVNG